MEFIYVFPLYTHMAVIDVSLNHHLGRLGADERAFSSTCSMTMLAKMALTGDPIGQRKLFFSIFVCPMGSTVSAILANLRVRTGVKEHAKAILDKNSLMVKHHVLHNHQTKIEIVDRPVIDGAILEAWHSTRNRNAINEHMALP